MSLALSADRQALRPSHLDSDQCLYNFSQVIGADNQRRIDWIKVRFFRDLGESLKPDFQLFSPQR
jgi:hypothetical protein